MNFIGYLKRANSYLSEKSLATLPCIFNFLFAFCSFQVISKNNFNKKEILNLFKKLRKIVRKQKTWGVNEAHDGP